MRISWLYAIGFLSTFAGNTKSAVAQQKTNIIYILSDDHAYQAISAYDDKLTTTPNIDRIAENGMLFTNAFVNNSIFAPSRAEIHTDKHSNINGKTDNIASFDTSQRTFPQIFLTAGCQTSMFGKLHFGNTPKGVDDYLTLPRQGVYLNPDFITPNGNPTIKGYVTNIVIDSNIDWLKNRDKDKPFVLMYFNKAPHRREQLILHQTVAPNTLLISEIENIQFETVFSAIGKSVCQVNIIKSDRCHQIFMLLIIKISKGIVWLNSLKDIFNVNVIWVNNQIFT